MSSSKQLGDLSMNNKTSTSVAEQLDKIMQKTALGVLFVACAYTMSILKIFFDEPISTILDFTKLALGILTVVMILPGFVKGIQLRKKYGAACKEPEGFIVEMFNKATGKSFQFTFIFLIFLEMISRSHFAYLPTEFFLKLTIAVTLAIFSLTFFYLSRSDSYDDTADEFTKSEVK